MKLSKALIRWSKSGLLDHLSVGGVYGRTRPDLVRVWPAVVRASFLADFPALTGPLTLRPTISCTLHCCSMKRSIKEPIPEIFETWAFLNQAADAHLAGDRVRADVFFKQANSRAVWEWVHADWQRPGLNVVVRKPPDDTHWVPKNLRDLDRNIAPAVRTAVLKRDGYRCRYCGIPVVSMDIRKRAHRLYPDAVPWDSRDPEKQHAGFACFWLQFDHVVPHCHGGRSSEGNVVIACALCNYGKDRYTLRQLDVADPFLTDPVPCEWDGLERFR